jgi:biopolymer transport protein ExbD
MRPAIPALRSEINVTPFVDVCLVMLIIFMVVTPRLVDPRDLALPETARPRPLADAEQLVLSLRADGLLRLGESVLTVEEAAQLVRDAGAVDGRVRLRADRGLPYERLRGVAAELSRAGLRRLELATARPVPPG